MENFNNRNCNEELLIKLIGKLTLEFKELEVDLPKQLKIKRIVEQTLYEYEVMSKETALVTSDLDGKINYFLATKKLEGLSPTTLRNYGYTLGRLATFFKKPVSTITSADIKMFMYAESESKCPSGLNTFMTPIRIFFSWLQNEEFIIKNPCATIRPVKEPKRVRKPLNEEELEILRDTEMNKRDKAIFEFFIATGCRVAEVSNVKISDIDFTNKTLLVIGKGNKERRVYFTERCKRSLLNYLKEREENNIKSEFLFISSRVPYKKMDVRGYECIVDRMTARSGITKRITPHIFRHTFATNALKSGMKPEIIQQILGHQDVGITLKVYAKLAQSEVEHDYRKLIS